MDRARILIVDDEERIREMIREYAGSEGFVIDEAGDGLEALELFKKADYSLVILDVMAVNPLAPANKMKTFDGSRYESTAVSISTILLRPRA